MVRLYTFVVSHFSEKVRFAFDLAGIRYDERPLLPGLHVRTIRKLARATTVPVLVHEGTAVQGSSAILDYAEGRLGLALGPSAHASGARELEALADEAFGRGAQTILYEPMLRDPAAMIELWTQGRSAAWRVPYRLAFPLIAKRIRDMYDASPKAVGAAKDRFLRALDETDRALGDRPYFAGDAPGRADVALASLLAPVCTPEEHVVRWPEQLPPDIEAFVRDVEERPTLQHTRRMYREHRAARGSDQSQRLRRK